MVQGDVGWGGIQDEVRQEGGARIWRHPWNPKARIGPSPGPLQSCSG